MTISGIPELRLIFGNALLQGVTLLLQLLAVHVRQLTTQRVQLLLRLTSSPLPHAVRVQKRLLFAQLDVRLQHRLAQLDRVRLRVQVREACGDLRQLRLGGGDFTLRGGELLG